MKRGAAGQIGPPQTFPAGLRPPKHPLGRRPAV